MTNRTAAFEAARIKQIRSMSAGDMRARMDEMWTPQAIEKWERIRTVAGIITALVLVTFFFMIPKFLAFVICTPLVYLGYEIMKACTNILKMAHHEELRPHPIKDGLPGLIERIGQYTPLVQRALTFYYEAKHPPQMGIPASRARREELWTKASIEKWELIRIVAGIVTTAVVAIFLFLAPKFFALLICVPYLYLGYETVMATTNILKLARHKELRPDPAKKGFPKLIEQITQHTPLVERVLTFYYKAKYPVQMQGA